MSVRWHVVIKQIIQRQKFGRFTRLEQNWVQEYFLTVQDYLSSNAISFFKHPSLLPRGLHALPIVSLDTLYVTEILTGIVQN